MYAPHLFELGQPVMELVLAFVAIIIAQGHGRCNQVRDPLALLLLSWYDVVNWVLGEFLRRKQ
jgi:hypothetical protein